MSTKKEKIKKLQQLAGQLPVEKPYERDEDERIVISMNVNNDDSFLSPFSQSETPLIATEVADFIEESTNGIPAYEGYTLRIKSDCIDEKEQVVYTGAIQAYFQKRYLQNERERKQNVWLCIVCAIVGVLVLSLALILEYVANAVWAEFIDIVAWVLIWEAVYVEAFENRKARSKRYYYLACMTMRVEYVKK